MSNLQKCIFQRNTGTLCIWLHILREKLNQPLGFPTLTVLQFFKNLRWFKMWKFQQQKNTVINWMNFVQILPRFIGQIDHTSRYNTIEYRDYLFVIRLAIGISNACILFHFYRSARLQYFVSNENWVCFLIHENTGCSI